MAQKVSVNLSDEVLSAARELAAKHDATLSDVLRRAIATEVFLDRECAERGKSLLLRDETTKELERITFLG